MKTYKGIPVRKKRTIYNLFFPRARGIASFGKIYLIDRLYINFISGELDVETEGVLEHELNHVKAYKDMGLRHPLIDWLRRKFRYEMELNAIREEMRVYKKKGERFDITKRAKQLSSLSYVWSTEYETAVKDLNIIWKEI